MQANRTAQYKEAVAWCQQEKKGGYAASHRKDEEGNWFWPLVTEGSCNRRLSTSSYVDLHIGLQVILAARGALLDAHDEGAQDVGRVVVARNQGIRDRCKESIDDGKLIGWRDRHVEAFRSWSHRDACSDDIAPSRVKNWR